MKLRLVSASATAVSRLTMQPSILRDVEDLSTAETAVALDLTEQNVKVRLHRGRAMARGWLLERVGSHAKSAFPFLAPRCDRVVASVISRLNN